MLKFGRVKKFGGDYLRDDIDYTTLSKYNCLPYCDIFDTKNINKFVFECRGNKYFVVDVYCINPSCECNDVVLIFHRFDFEKDSYCFRLDIRLDFITKKYYLENGIENVEELEVKDIYDCFKKNLNDPSYKILKERYARMKKLDNIMEQNSPDQNYSQKIITKNLEITKIGRNDPCPCGSGKKYKKCCLI